MKSRKIIVLISIFTVFIFCFSACSGSGDDGSGSSEDLLSVDGNGETDGDDEGDTSNDVDDDDHDDDDGSDGDASDDTDDTSSDVSGDSDDDSVTEIIMFSGLDLTSGNLGGRAGADTLCTDAKPAGFDCPNEILAFLSVDADDELRDMETNYGLDVTLPINATDGTLVAENFAKIISEDATVLEANAILDHVGISNSYFPTGSNADGSVDETLTCSGWTSDAAGNFHDVDAMNQGMVPEGSGDCIDGTDPGGFAQTLLCLCW